MPEYLAPGVYVEETSFRSKSIEGVGTTTTGFIGPTRFGPIDIEPDVITSVGEFERVYGDRQQLTFGQNPPTHNFMWHAVRAFFEEGGKRLYISRVFKPSKGDYPPNPFPPADPTKEPYDDGHARACLPSSAGASAIQIRARFPGQAGNVRVRFTLRMGQNVLAADPARGGARINSIQDQDIVWIGDTTSPIHSPPGTGDLYLAELEPQTQTWNFNNQLSPPGNLKLRDLHPEAGDNVRLVTLTITVIATDSRSLPMVWSDLPLDPAHQRDGVPDSFLTLFEQHTSNLDLARSLPIVLETGVSVTNGLDVVNALFDYHKILTHLDHSTSSDAIIRATSTDLARSVEVLLGGGNDGVRATANEYEGQADDSTTTKSGLKAFEDIDDIAIVAAPGSTYGYELDAQHTATANTILDLLIGHAQLMRYRIAVLDSGNGQSIAQIRALRAKFDSTYAALYYPWVRILDPVTNAEIYLPPSGFVAGIYARNDINRAVYKAPANEVVTLALGFEHLLNKSQQEVLNPEGINCFRFFEGRGYRLWGARTISSDPEWKYVNLRRYFIYLEHSIDKGTQFAVFEPNGPALWANVRRTIEDFLLNEWQSGALLGDKPEKAYFVRCDRSTMTQNDLDNGRLVCLIGVAPLRPAEFVIFRIGQFTADQKS